MLGWMPGRQEGEDLPEDLPDRAGQWRRPLPGEPACSVDLTAGHGANAERLTAALLLKILPCFDERSRRKCSRVGGHSLLADQISGGQP